MKAKKILSVFLVTVILICVCFTQSAAAESLFPVPDWVTVTLNRDGSKTLTISTPQYMLDTVDYYEYSLDGFDTVSTLNISSGGEFVFDKTVDFSLRYVTGGFKSPVYTVNVDVSKTTAITSSSGITLIIPFDSKIPVNVYLSAYEMTSGRYFDAVAAYFGELRSVKLLFTAIMHNNKLYETEENKTWLFSCEGFDVNYCKIYYLSDNGDLFLLSSKTEINSLLITTNLTGMFVIVEDKMYSTGDVDGDTKITAADARLALRISAALEDATQQQINAGDIDKSGEITAADARKILRFSAELDIINV